MEIEKASETGLEKWFDFASYNGGAKNGAEWLEEFFGGDVGADLMWCLGFNRVLGGYVADVMGLLRKGKGE